METPELGSLLAAIKDSDPSADNPPRTSTGTEYELAVRYTVRNRLIMLAMVTAQRAGLGAGLGFDPNEPDRIVVYIDLPTGQVSWHVAAYEGAWDGHTTTEKYARCAAYAAHAERTTA